MPGKPSLPLQAATGMNSASSSVLHNHVNWQFLHLLCRGWNRLCKVWTRGESGPMNFSPLCKPSLILTISQPFLCTHQQARTKFGITLCCTVSQQTARFQVFLYSFFFFFSILQSVPLFPLVLYASLVLLRCYSIFVLAGFGMALSACSSLIQDLDEMHTNVPEKGEDSVHWSLPALLFFFTCLYPLPTVVHAGSTTSQKMKGDASLKCCPAHSSLIKILFSFIFHHFIS